MRIFILILTLIGFYEIIVKVSQIRWKEGTDKLHLDARRNRLRILHQRGDISSYESAQQTNYSIDS